MLFNYSWAVWLAWLLAVFFVASGVLNLASFRPMVEGFARWGLPRWFNRVNGCYDLATGVMIAWYPTRPLGLLLSLLVCVVVWIVLLRHRDFSHLPPSIVLFAVTLVAAWGLRLI